MRLFVLRRLPLFECTLSATGPRIFRLSHRLVYAALGDNDGGMCAIIGAAGGEPWNAAFSPDLRYRVYLEHAHVDQVDAADLCRLVAYGVRALRRGSGYGERGNLEQRGGGDAVIASGRSRC